MKQRLALFVALVFGLLACKSSGPHDTDTSSNLSTRVDFNEPQTFAQLADERIHQSFVSLWKELERLNEAKVFLPSSDEALTLERNLITFEDMLEIFVHVLPAQDEEDPFLDLYGDLEVGRGLLGRLRAPGISPELAQNIQKEILNWVERMTSVSQRDRYATYLSALNQSRATRRTIPVLENYCWGRVDYIPQLRGSAVRELQDFMKALLNATRSAALEARDIEDILPADQRQAFHATRRKSRSILAMNRYFAQVFEDEARVRKALPVLEAFSERYENFNGLLMAYDKLKDKSAQDARALGEKINEEWSAIKAWQTTLAPI